jgi:PHD/YefM family antitoxin component YafN of YafNO toxin-antitoxin module
MPHIIPIQNLKNTGEISQMCHESSEPIYITKDGYGDMVLMSIETYEKNMLLADLYQKLADSEAQIADGKVLDADVSLKRVRAKYHV